MSKEYWDNPVWPSSSSLSFRGEAPCHVIKSQQFHARREEEKHRILSFCSFHWSLCAGHTNTAVAKILKKESRLTFALHDNAYKACKNHDYPRNNLPDKRKGYFIFIIWTVAHTFARVFTICMYTFSAWNFHSSIASWKLCAMRLQKDGRAMRL